MRKSIFTLALLTLATLLVAPPAAAARLELSTSVVEPGYIPGCVSALEFSLENEETVFGVQTDITLPKGVTLHRGLGGSDLIALSYRLDESFACVVNETSPGSLRLALFSTSGTPVKGDEGVLFSLYVDVAESFQGGDVKTSETHLTLAGNTDNRIGGSSRWLASNYKLYAYADDVTAERGAAQTLLLCLANSESFSGMQGDIILPAGLSFAIGNYGEPEISPVERIAGYTLATNLKSERELTFAAFSTQGTMFRSGDSPMLSFIVNVSDSYEGGEWRADNLILTSSEGKDVHIDGCSAAVNVNAIEPVNLIGFTGASGDSVELDKATPFSLTLDNETPVAGLQADFHLPAGLSADNFRLTERCAPGFTLSTKLFEEERRVRVVVASLSGSTLEGNFGPVLDFDLTASASIQPISDLTIGNVRISDPEGKEYILENLTATLYLVAPEPEPDPTYVVTAKVCELTDTDIIENGTGGAVAISPEAESYLSGDEVTFTATAAEGYEFRYFLSGEEKLEQNPLALTIADANVELKAVFEAIKIQDGMAEIDADFSNGNIYDLNGRRVNGEPVPGIYVRLTPRGAEKIIVR